MKKVLLTLIAAIGLPMLAAARDYNEPAYSYTYDGWEGGFDGHIEVDGRIIAECRNDNEIVLRNWMGVEGYDLKLTFDEDDNVTEFVAVKDGEESVLDGGAYGYAAVESGLEAEPTYNLYVVGGSGYSYAGYDTLGGYVLLTLFDGSYANSYYYYVYWEHAKAVESAVTTENEDYAPGYDDCILLDQPVEVETYDGYVIIRGWMGVENNDLRVEFDENDNVTAVEYLQDDEVVYRGVPGDYMYAYTGLDDPYYVSLYIGEGYDYAGYDDEGGYVFLSLALPDESWVYYQIEWIHTETAPAQFYTTAVPSIYETWADWYEAYLPETVATVYVDSEDAYIYVTNWAGDSMYGFTLYYDEETYVTSFTPIINGEYGETFTEGDVELPIGADTESVAVVSLDSSYAYTEEGAGYIVLYLTIEDEGFKGYYYLPINYQTAEEEQPETGDANGDGQINVSDVSAMIDYIMGNGAENFSFEAADINGDEEINVNDVTGLIDIILNGDAEE